MTGSIELLFECAEYELAASFYPVHYFSNCILLLVFRHRECSGSDRFQLRWSGGCGFWNKRVQGILNLGWFMGQPSEGLNHLK